MSFTSANVNTTIANYSKFRSIAPICYLALAVFRQNQARFSFFYFHFAWTFLFVSARRVVALLMVKRVS